MFFGESGRHDNVKEFGGWNMRGPLFVLMAGSLFAGFMYLPLDIVFSQGEPHEEHHVSALIHGIMIVVPLLGIGIAYLFYGSRKLSTARIMGNPFAQSLHNFWFSGWGLDSLYNRLFVNPFLWLARVNQNDIVDKIYDFLVELSRTSNRFIVQTQTGYLRWYALTVATGLVFIITLGILL